MNVILFQSPYGATISTHQQIFLSIQQPNPNVDNFKELDPENLELLQEQAALQRAIMESNTKSKPAVKPAPQSPKKVQALKSLPKESVISEEEALQRAIYESTHEASSPKPAKSVAAVAAAPKKNEHENWLRMSSQDVSFSLWILIFPIFFWC